VLERHNFHTGKDYKSSPYDYIQPLPKCPTNIKKINIFMYIEYLRTSLHCSNAADPDYDETGKRYVHLIVRNCYKAGFSFTQQCHTL
jgi:hypothetical protein